MRRFPDVERPWGISPDLKPSNPDRFGLPGRAAALKDVGPEVVFGSQRYRTNSQRSYVGTGGQVTNIENVVMLPRGY